MWSYDDAKVELKQAIRGLYDTFRGYHQPLKVGYYDTHDDVRMLESRPLHDLEWPQLEKLANKALTTMGSLEDFKRFLPRLLELVTKLRPPGICHQIVLGKISYADRDPCAPKRGKAFSAFSAKERAAIDAFCAAWWRRELAVEPTETKYELPDVLESIGCATSDISPYLRIWESADGLTARLQLATLMNRSSSDIYRSRKLGFAFWCRELEGCEHQLMGWLASAECREMLERPILDGTAGRHADVLSQALGVLEFLAARQA